MINITLPDGSRRPFDQPVSVAEIAASIGPGLAKAATARMQSLVCQLLRWRLRLEVLAVGGVSIDRVAC